MSFLRNFSKATPSKSAGDSVGVVSGAWCSELLEVAVEVPWDFSGVSGFLGERQDLVIAMSVAVMMEEDGGEVAVTMKEDGWVGFIKPLRPRLPQHLARALQQQANYT
jgi:hypothetical protein